MKNSNHPILLFLVIAILTSCREDQGCPDAIYLGTFEPTEHAISFVPYAFVKSVVFEDSLGTQVEFTRAPSTFRYDHWEIPGPCPENYYETVDFIHDGGHWEISLVNDSLPFQLIVSVLSVQEYKTRKIYDDLVIDLYEPGVHCHQSLNLPVDQRLLRDPEFERVNNAIRQEEAMDFFGRTFHDVYHNLIPMDHPFKTFYTADQGIVAFRNKSGKLWVLKELR
jgi:hypothetical protein